MANSETIVINGTTYKLGEQIGSGGAGNVYFTKSGTDMFAIKKIKLYDKTKPKGEIKNQRFRKEVEYCSKYHSDHVIRILDWRIKRLKNSDDSFSEYLYYLMPLYKNTLRKAIEEDLPIDAKFDYLIQLYSAISQIHKEGVIHRDIKPENILIDNDTLVLADFGIAHFKDSNITVEKDLLANRGYFAPEQGKDHDARDVGPEADIFAIGLITNELFTKSKPVGSHFTKISDLYPYLSDLDTLVEKMTDQNPHNRINIEFAINELQRIRLSFEKSWKKIKGVLIEKATSPINQAIIDQAALEILSAHKLIKTLRQKDWSKYNPNYHDNIYFRVTDDFKNASICCLFLECCKKKMNYESNAYTNMILSQDFKQYENGPNEEQLKRLEEKLTKYNFKLPDKRMDKVHNYIRKHFISCCDYHCNELLESIEQIREEVEYNLDDAPIFWIARYIATQIPSVINPVESFDLCLFVEITSEFSSSYSDSSGFLLVDNRINKDRNIDKAIRILDVFQKEWPETIYSFTDTQAIVFFNSSSQYKNFYNFARNKAKDDFIFEGDVIDLLNPTRWNNDLIQLTLSISFDVLHTLARLLDSD